MLTEDDIDRIASALNIVRPDWPAKSIRTFIAKNLADRPRRDVFVALAWISCEPNTATPARVLEAGPWWRAAAVDATSGARRHPKPEEACRNCGHEYRPGRGGYGGVVVGACCDNPTQRPSSSDYPTQAARARVLLHSPTGEDEDG